MKENVNMRKLAMSFTRLSYFKTTENASVNINER